MLGQGLNIQGRPKTDVVSPKDKVEFARVRLYCTPGASALGKFSQVPSMLGQVPNIQERPKTDFAFSKDKAKLARVR